MKTRQAIAIEIGLILTVLVYTALSYPHLPDRLPIHWNIRGEIDGWADKRYAVLLMPAFMTALAALGIILPWLTPRRYDIANFRASFDYLMMISVGMMGYIHVLMLQAGRDPSLDFPRWLLTGLFLFLALMANILGRIRRNPWMGIRTPWTLSNDAVWIATHRFAAREMLVLSLLGAVAVMLGAPPATFILYLLFTVLLPVVYSYFLSRRM